MNPDYEGLIGYLKEKSAIPLVIVFANETSNGITLDYLTTPAYDDADATLKKDIIKTTRRVVDELAK